MTHDESAIHQLAERLQGTDASLTTSIAEILGTALQELIAAELSATIGAEPASGFRPGPRNATGIVPSGCRPRRGMWSWASPSCARAASSPSCSSRDVGSARPCGR
jgi:hypothetical protein